MAVTETSNNGKIDLLSQYFTQRQQEKMQTQQAQNTEAQRQTEQRAAESNSEGVRVSISRRGRTTAAERSVERTQEIQAQANTELQNAEARRAAQAYQTVSRAAERENNERLERLRERQIKRVVG